MDELPLRADEAVDQLPHGAATDSLLSIDADAPAPKGVASTGLGSKMALGAIGLLVVAAMVAVVWLLLQASPHTNTQLQPPPQAGQA
jgi:hypothetical protein